MSGNLTIRNVLSTIGNILFSLVLAVFALLTVVILLLQTVFFQNFLAEKLVALINEQTQEQVSLSKVKIRWFDSVVIKDLRLTDYKENEMVRAGKLHVNYDLIRILRSKEIKLDQLELTDAQLNLKNYDDSLGINLIEFVNNLSSSQKKDKQQDSVKKPLKLSLAHLYLENVDLSYQNQANEPLGVEGKLDFSNVDLNLREAIFDDFLLYGDTIKVEVGGFSALETNSNFEIKNWSSLITFTPQTLQLDDLTLDLAKSHIARKIHLSFNDLSSFGNFFEEVRMDLDLKNTKLYTEDLSAFVDLGSEIPSIFFEGEVSGTLSGLSVRNMVLGARERTEIHGSIDMFGLPNIEETFMDVQISKAEVWAEDFNDLLNDFPNQTGVKRVDLKGQFAGFLNDFVAKVDLKTGQGRLVSDINLKLPKDWRKAEYSGNVKVTNFNAGVFINDRKLLQEINFNGFIEGKGLDIEHADVYAEGELTNAGIYGYNYQSIKAKGKFASQYFDGALHVEDPNMALDISGTVDLSTKPEKIVANAAVEKINFLELGLTDEDIRLKTDIDLELYGLDIDSLISDTRIENTVIGYEQKELEIDSIIFTTQNTGTGRDVFFAVPDFQGRIHGDFYYSQVASDLTAFSQDLISYFNPTEEKDTSYVIDDSAKDYKVTFDLKYGDLNDYIRFFTRRIYVAPDGTVSGEFVQRKNATVSFFAEVDSVNYEGIGLTENSIDVNVSMDHMSKGILAMAYLHSTRQIWRDIPNSSNLVVEAVWENDHLDLNTNIAQKETDSRASINLALDFYKDNLALTFKPSILRVLGDDWSFSRNNRIEFDGATVVIDQLELSQNEQVIALNGVYSDSLSTDISLLMRNFHMMNLNTVVPVRMDGLFNGQLNLTRETGDATNLLNGSINIRDLYVDDVFVGSVSGDSEWDDKLGRLNVDFGIQRKSINTIALKGSVHPNRDSDQLDLNLKFDDANLVLLSPVVAGTLSDVSGKADGKITIKGNMDSPMLDGHAEVVGMRFTYDYLGVSYIADGSFDVNNESIVIEQLDLRDKDNNRATVSGRIDHQNFGGIRPNIHLDTRRFSFLNTPSTTGELYYGTAYASGTIDVTGSIDDLLIAANIRSEKGTKIYLPLQDGGEVEQKEYIIFRDFQDTTSASAVDDVLRNSISGVRLDFDMEVTPDAYIELIFDKRAGDIIRGSAYGNLNLILDTNGEFELFGDVNITEGAYNFTSSIKGRTFLAKEFTVDPGSTITWYGDPLSGVLNLRAIYSQMASLSDYRNTGTDSEEEVSQRLPILVVLTLRGEMFTPDISFEIKLDDDQALASNSDKAEILSINSNEQELKRQVFSLLMLKRFSPKDEFTVQGGASAVSSLSEFLSNQLSYYASQFNENLEVDLDLTSMDQNALNTLQLRLSYSFLDGRLKVSGAGGFNQNAGTTSDNNSFIGDWSVRYLLTSDGRLRARAFSQADQIAGVQQRETGVSLQIIRSFDDLRELLNTSKIRDLIRRREEEADREEEI